MYFSSGKSYKVLISESDATGELVTMKVNGKTYYVEVGNNGYASLKVNLNPKSYTITAMFKGYVVKNKIIVKPLLTAKNISVKKSKKIRFTAKLVNTKGKVVKGKKITFKIKGKKYKVKTNRKGKATLTLRNLKVGKYTIKTTYGKSTIENTIKIKK